ncbi:phosphopyruvate hydratase [Psychrobacillus lasiicapitis]|nr:phosphopyruvate hydratase [Psychrobacillus lasiicapitis]GGA28588.1 enolase [Psychrobacillus lasiicapitis]
MKIKEIKARQLIDCKCRPMIEVDVITEDGYIGRGSAPTGSSVGMYEAFVLRDNNPNEYKGLSVRKAVENINNVIAPALIGKNVIDQEKIDRIMIDLDGTELKTRLGGNAIYSVSIACMHAAAKRKGLELYEYIANGAITSVPVPSFNVINGGKYDNLVQPFNEFLIVPYKAKNIEEAVEMSVLVFQELEKVLTNYLGRKPNIASSYGYAAPSEDPEIILELIQSAIDNCGYKGKIAFALDCASSEMYDKATDTYQLKGKQISAIELVDYVEKLTTKFDFVFIEDLLDENDWKGFIYAIKTIDKALILGDDLIVTNKDKLMYAHQNHAVHGFILKPNQIGTITEALDTFDFAHNNGLLAIPSGRSGGVIGDICMDLAVGLHVPFIKNGAPRSGERIDKLNYLMRVADLSNPCPMSDISSLVKFNN